MVCLLLQKILEEYSSMAQLIHVTENMTGAMDTAEEGNSERVVDDQGSSGGADIGASGWGNIAAQISAGRTAGPKSQRARRARGAGPGVEYKGGD